MSRRSNRRRDPLSRLAGVTPGTTKLPHHPCTACFQGDATRAVVFNGDDDWLADALVEATGHSMPKNEAVALVQLFGAEGDLGPTDHGRMMRVRLCRACADEARDRIPGLPVHSAAKLGPGHVVRPFTQLDPEWDVATVMAVLRRVDDDDDEEVPS